MDQINALSQMLELITRPAFAVKDGQILLANAGARQLLLVPGTRLDPMLNTCREDYSRFQEGCMALQLQLGEELLPAQAVQLSELVIFTLDEASDPRLQAMALAAEKLRTILADTITAADRLLPNVAEDAKPQAAGLTRGLYQLLRNVGNMSDADKYSRGNLPQTTVEADSFFRELTEKAAALLEQKQITLTYSGLSGTLYCLMQQELMERAVYNLISNAVRHMPAGGTVQARLSRSGSRLHFSLEDNNLDAPDPGSILGLSHRGPGMEDSRKGIGLGMVLVRQAAAAHGGTVLIEKPAGLRVTLSFPIRQGGSQVRTPVFGVDYTGELDHGLIELSDVLPRESYQLP